MELNPHLAVYRKASLERRVPIIMNLTYTDERGRRYYRRSTWDAWRNLKTPTDFDQLNAAIDAVEKVHAGIA